jgi:hypothetical protein
MKYGWMRKASDWFIASVVLMLIVIAYGGCGTKALVGDFSLQPAQKVEVGGKLFVSISIDNPPKDKRLRFVWNAKGKVPSEDQPGGEYIAPNEPGTDIITCEVWSDSKHLATRTATVEVIPAPILLPTTESDQPESQEPKKSTQTSPSITITRVPPAGAGSDSFGTIAGKVQGVNVEECKVVIFAYVDIWYVQPWANSPYTEIDEDGSWETDIHLGFEYAALLVKSSYKPPATTSTLPQSGGDVLAIAKATPKE